MRKMLRTLAVSAALLVGVSATASGTPDYGPRDETERGLWQQMDEYERDLKTSEFLMTDPALNAYVKGVLCKAVGTERCGATRIYIVRTPQYNAMMAPNGMMIVWSGLLLRTRNEAELATVLGHEFAHFEKRHSIQMYNNVKSKTDAMTWLSVLPGGFLAQMSLMGSVMSFNRDMERQADLVAVDEIDLIGYPESYRLELMNGDLRISERKALDFWLKNKCPLIIDLTDAEQKLSEKELAEFRSNNLQNIWAHGVIDPDGQKASYFSFSGSNELCSEQVSLRLRMVTPYLHQVRSAILWSRLSQNGFIHAPGNRNRQRGTESDTGFDGGDGAVHSVLQVEMPNGR